MGQNNSRTSPEQIRPTTASSASSPPATAAATISTVNEPSVVPSSSSQPNASPSPDTIAGRPQRTPVHQSILNLVKRRATSSDNDALRGTPNGSASSIPTSSSHSSKKRWRSSRRWSKAPAVSESAQSLDTNNPSSDVVDPSSSSSPSPDKGKGKENESDVSHLPSHSDSAVVLPEDATSSASIDRPSTPYPHSFVHPFVNTESQPSTSASQGPNGSTSDDTNGVSSDIDAEPGRSQPQGSRLDRLGPMQSESVAEATHEPVVSRNSESTGTTNPDTLPSSFNVPTGLMMPSTMPGPTELDSGPLPTRQFPPPGTLVVVQGVVHTTDVPSSSTPPPRYETPPPRSSPSLQFGIRRRASSTPRSSTPTLAERTSTGNNSRNRLSALIPRSLAPSSLTSPSSEDTLSSRPSADNTSSASTSTSDNVSDTGGHSGSVQSTRDTEGRESDARGLMPTGPISSSSIDVLGTLLSVAAAATAASLLTGSSEPIFSSGLPQRNNDNPSPPAPNFMRPTSPTPTAGFGGLPFGLGSADSDTTHGQESGWPRGRDRVRHAWGSLRERLGLRAANQNANNSGNDTNMLSRLRPDGTPMDAREVMLAEMARAFNLGLGLGSENPGEANASRAGPDSVERDRTSSDNVDTAQTNNALGRPVPPEDSFERFLMDLQSELRVVLSQPATGGENTVPHPASSQPIAVGGSPSATSSTTSAPTPPITTTRNTAEADEEEQMPPLEDISGSEVEDHNDAQDEAEDDDPVTPTTDSDMPPLVSDMSSSSIFPFPPTAGSPLASTDDSTPGTTPRATAGGSTHRTENRPAGGINWWRLYRFPPITSPHPQGVPAPFTATGLAGSQTPAPHITPQTTTGSAPSATAATPSTPSDGRPQTVIPVIVVGLQSVNTGNRRREQASGESNDNGGRDADANDNIEDDVEFDGFPPDGDLGNGDAQRGRRWHSRAASAIRNLRPGRRSTPGRNTTNEGSGSRTFLIYVIGGYYPPDHHIVTGANTLDSFEALWELAELLGQVKPPTATKEEIERSGLEVVKPNVLAQYEKEGKVASNCTEKCLICLDEYGATEDVRLMTCRHAFHKNCVDKWLETGRNNCPACRSKGVSTDEAPNMYAQASA